MNDMIASPPLEKLDSVWRLFCNSSNTRIDERRDTIIKCTEILKTFKAKEVAALREWALRNVINNRDIIGNIAGFGDFELQSLAMRFLHTLLRIVKYIDPPQKRAHPRIFELLEGERVDEGTLRTILNQINSGETSSVFSFKVAAISVRNSNSDNWECQNLWIDFNVYSITIWLQNELLLLEIMYEKISRWEVQPHNLLYISSDQGFAVEIAFQTRGDLAACAGIIGLHVKKPCRFSVTAQHIDCEVSGPIYNEIGTDSKSERETVFTSSSLVEHSQPIEMFQGIENGQSQESLSLLEAWTRYLSRDLFDLQGDLKQDLRALKRKISHKCFRRCHRVLARRQRFRQTIAHKIAAFSAGSSEFIKALRLILSRKDSLPSEAGFDGADVAFAFKSLPSFDAFRHAIA